MLILQAILCFEELVAEGSLVAVLNIEERNMDLNRFQIRIRGSRM